MNRFLLLFAAMSVASTGVPIMAQDVEPEYEITIPSGTLTKSSRMYAGSRYLIADGGGYLCKPVEENGEIHIGRSSKRVYAGTELDESYFWTVESPAESETPGYYAVKHIQSNGYIAALEYSELCKMTADIAAAAQFRYSGSGQLLQPDSEGGLGLLCDSYYDTTTGSTLYRFRAGWDEDMEQPAFTSFSFYDVDDNGIITEKYPRMVTLTLPQHDGEDVVVTAKYYDGDKIDVDNLPYFGCFTATGFGERSRTVSATNCRFTVKGTWDEPMFKTVDHIFAMGNAKETWLFSWFTYDGKSFDKDDVETTDYDDYGVWITPSVPSAEREYIWYFKTLRFDNGNYLVTVSNAMAPAGTGLTADATGKLSFTDTPTEFILSKTYLNYGYDKDSPRTSLVCYVDGKPMSFYGQDILYPFVAVDQYHEPYPRTFEIAEPEDAEFDRLKTFELDGATVSIDPAKREAAKQSRTATDYLAMFAPSPVDDAKIRYAELAGFEYGTAVPAFRLPGMCDVNDPVLTALAAAIAANDEDAAKAALAAAENIAACASAEYTEGAMFTLLNIGEYMVQDSSDPTRLTFSATVWDSTDAIEFAIVNYAGKKYIYCPSNGLFLSANGKQLVPGYSNSWTLSDAKDATPVDFICLKRDADISDKTPGWKRDFAHNADIVVAGADPILYCMSRYNSETKKSEIVVCTSNYTIDGYAGYWNFVPTGKAMTEDELAPVREQFSPKNDAKIRYAQLAGFEYGSEVPAFRLPGMCDVNDPILTALAEAIESNDEAAIIAALAAAENVATCASTEYTEGVKFNLFINGGYEYMIQDNTDPTRLCLANVGTADALEFSIVNYAGKKYIYCPANGLFLSANGKQLVPDYPNSWTLSDAKNATPVDFICLKRDTDLELHWWAKRLRHCADITVVGSDPTLYCALGRNQETNEYEEIVVKQYEGVDGTDFYGYWKFTPTGNAMTEEELAAVREQFSPKNDAIRLWRNLTGFIFPNTPYNGLSVPGYSLSDPRLVALANAINASDDAAMMAAMDALEGVDWIEPTDDITEGMVFGLLAVGSVDAGGGMTVLYIVVDSATSKLKLSKSSNQKAQFAVVKYEGKKYLYNLDTQQFVNAFDFGPESYSQSYCTDEVPTAFEFGVNKTGAPVEPSAINHNVELIGGQMVTSEEPVDGAFGWSDFAEGEDLIVKSYDGWHGSLRMSPAMEPEILDESVLAELRARIAAADEKVKNDLLELADRIGEGQIVNYPTRESVLAVANDETMPMDYRAWCDSQRMFDCHELTDGSVYTIFCASNYGGTDSDTDVFVNTENLILKAFAVDGYQCVLCDYAEGKDFNWLCNIDDDGSVSFVHYVPTQSETLTREASLAPVYLSLPAEHLGVHAEKAEPLTVFPGYTPMWGKGSGYVALPVANYSDASKTVWFPHLRVTKVSDDAADAGATTAINEVESDASSDEVYYDLSGRRVANPTPGRIYIVRSGNRTTKRIM